jgi:hypothetical protein
MGSLGRVAERDMGDFRKIWRVGVGAVTRCGSWAVGRITKNLPLLRAGLAALPTAPGLPTEVLGRDRRTVRELSAESKGSPLHRWCDPARAGHVALGGANDPELRVSLRCAQNVQGRPRWALGDGRL